VCGLVLDAELQQQCEADAATVVQLDAEKMLVSLIPQTDADYSRSLQLR